MKHLSLFSLICIFVLLTHGLFVRAEVQSSDSSMKPTRPRCEETINPLGVDATQPRLSWELQSAERGQRQTGYEILVASSKDKLEDDDGDLWSTGKIDSSLTFAIPYDGQKLTSSQQVFWKVRVWDKDANPSDWSDPQSWTMGLLSEQDWKGKWIVAPWVSEALLLRHEFQVRPELERALVHFCGLGQSYLTFNGKNASENLLSPGWTKFNRTCLYESFDVTSLLREGANVIGVSLGDGMYHTERRNRFSKFQGTFGPKRAIGQIELFYKDGTHETVATDVDWRVSRGPVTYNDIFGGEDFDARLLEKDWDSPGFDDSHWTEAVELVRPGGKLRGLSASAPPLREVEEIIPQAVTQLSETQAVIDFGQNASFMPRISASGPRGSTVRLTHAEILHDDGTINRDTCGGNRGPAYWQYTKATDGVEEWMPQFFYAGCRFLQVDKYPPQNGQQLPQLENCVGLVVHSSAEPLGEFHTSNELLDRIRTLVRWAQRSNMVSVLTDCPHREKLGWLEQYHLNGPAIRYEFDVNRIFAKGMQDMADSQLENGLVPNIAPEYTVFDGTFRAAAEWGSAVILVPWQQYQFTGDKHLLSQFYPQMQRYLHYLKSQAVDGIVSEGLGDWYDLGPNDRPGHAQLTLPPYTATAFYYHDAALLGKIAGLLGKEEDARSYEELAQSIREAWLREFRHEDGTYGSNSQCANAMALEMNLAKREDRSKVLAALLDDLKANNYATTAGDVGHRFVLQALAHGGHSDAIYKMINQDERPGYGYQLKKGATSLTEAWDANSHSSHNHFMLGHITEWFYGHLLGIQSDPGQPGFENIIIEPTLVGDLQIAEGTYHSCRGEITVRWNRSPTGYELAVTIPPNTTASVRLPAYDAEVLEGGKPVAELPEVELVGQEGDRQVYAIGSGNYRFEVRNH